MVGTTYEQMNRLCCPGNDITKTIREKRASLFVVCLPDGAIQDQQHPSHNSPELEKRNSLYRPILVITGIDLKGEAGNDTHAVILRKKTDIGTSPDMTKGQVVLTLTPQHQVSGRAVIRMLTF